MNTALYGIRPAAHRLRFDVRLARFPADAFAALEPFFAALPAFLDAGAGFDFAEAVDFALTGAALALEGAAFVLEPFFAGTSLGSDFTDTLVLAAFGACLGGRPLLPFAAKRKKLQILKPEKQPRESRTVCT